ncbi:hypothetical protein BDF21DRAFT_460058 [Thamnidium elegans]|nr:hypothetical protein BDF21DRAFT_460058 [Thamnidium elegans]
MDYKPIYPVNSPDVDSYQGSSVPSAPPIPSPQYVHYQTVPMPLPHQSEFAYRYAIKRKNTDGNHFPINASLFLLGLLLVLLEQQ